MFEQYPDLTILVFLIGVVAGIVLILLTNKLRSGSASPVKLKKEMDDYQDKVDAHFAETSQKFKQMTNQYQDLYQHLAEGATTLCRPDAIAAELIEDSSALGRKPAIEQKAKPDQAVAGKETDKKPTNKEEPSAKEKSLAKEKPIAQQKPEVKDKKTANDSDIEAKIQADIEKLKTQQKPSKS